MKKLTQKERRWQAELSLKLAARALGYGYHIGYILERLKEVGEFIGDSNLPSVERYFEETQKKP